MNSYGDTPLVTVITVSYNAEKTILRSIESVNRQKYKNIQHVFIDGASTDSTLSVISANSSRNPKIVSEPDAGIYDAMNKGMGLGDGSFFCILNADDEYENDLVIERLVNVAIENAADVVYSDVIHMKDGKKSPHRIWVAGEFSKSALIGGWMPPHPGVMISKKAAAQNMPYDTRYDISADYDFLLRIFLSENLKKIYHNNFSIIMYAGGHSQASLKNRFKKSTEDFHIVKRHLDSPWRTVILKNLRKLKQLRILDW